MTNIFEEIEKKTDIGINMPSTERVVSIDDVKKAVTKVREELIEYIQVNDCCCDCMIDEIKELLGEKE